jgi:2-polyprenyl-3-methyl-5-hydroxy-6-metoxy-1,4-benzoquinol methylase|tara:strand:+ start:457 stop:1680 length:1224 start_codon:yes stop_codon:yes gene_type:complete
MNCRNCEKTLKNKWIDLGFSPPSNNYLSKKDLIKNEKILPLKVYVCKNCWLSQTQDYTNSKKLFRHDYAYYSSTSKSFVNHAKKYSDKIIKKLHLSSKSNVIEIASNDGYLLKNFLRKKIPCFGIEPTINTAKAAEKIGIRVIKKFFSSKLSKKLIKDKKQADLIIGNNVFAHVPDILDFTKGMSILLKKNGTITLEFPHLLELMKYSQFDTVYHEHFSYLSLIAVKNIFSKFDLKIYDVEKIKTHGGSLRIYVCKKSNKNYISKNVKKIINQEKIFGLNKITKYNNFQIKIEKIKYTFLKFLKEKKLEGNKICGYGAAAKGNTLLNYCEVKTDMIDFVCDAAQSKQNKRLPGSHIPIFKPNKIMMEKPNYIIIFPWNLTKEISSQLSFIKKWQGKFVTVIPNLKIF